MAARLSSAIRAHGLDRARHTSACTSLPSIGGLCSRFAARLVLATTLAASAALAQDALQLVPAAEAQALRRTLSAPVPSGVPTGVLRQHFTDKVAAAQRLGDVGMYRTVLRAAMQALPQDSRWPNDLAAQLEGDGRWDEARQLYITAIELSQGVQHKAFATANLLRLRVLRSETGVESDLASARAAALMALDQPPTDTAQRVVWLRVRAMLDSARWLWHSRSGRPAEALAAAADAVSGHRAALLAAEALRPVPAQQVRAIASALAAAQKSHASELRQFERDAEAETVLQEHLQTIAQYPVGAGYAAGAHHAFAVLRMSQRRWVDAETELRLALKVVDSLGWPGSAPGRIDKLADLAGVLWEQGRSAEAQSLFDELDLRLAADGAARSRARLLAPRALALLGVGRTDEAADLFGEAAKARLTQHGAGHHLAAQMQGLHGVALWRSSDPARREQGAELLRTAVPDMLSPRNSDLATDRGHRRSFRLMIMAAYVDAMTQRGGLPALWAMGVADRLRGGITSQALGDAALRAAANEPVLGELVRQDQDARREWDAGEQLLQSGGGDTGPLSPEATAQLRTRMAAIGQQRQHLQQRLRERFPGYEQLQRPPLPDPAAVSQRLARDEAMLVLVPTDTSLLAWTLSADELPVMVRLPVSRRTLQALVQRLLADVNPGGTRLPPFDPAVAHELYRLVIEPLLPRLQSKQQLIIAASGPLAALPFATLVAAPPGRGAPDWLVRRWALVQVPSVEAWLSLRQLPRGRAAPEALAGWGDPTFDFKSVRAASGASKPRPAQRASVAAGMRYEELPPLPDTRDELLAIAAALKADPARDLRLGPQATRESVLEASRSGELARKRVVAFATHGLMAREVPGLLDPALALAAPAAGSGFEAGLLTLQDVLGLKLNADWVLLSACNTASNDGRAEEVLSGLARGFFYAGSRSLLVTQWAVETESARLLTTRVFEHHAAQPLAGKGESLRQAMLQVMALPQFAHPMFWAPYMLVGDGAR